MANSANQARGRSPAADAPALLRRAPDHPGSRELISIADAAVCRLVGVGLLLESATDLAHGPGAEQIQRAASELDGIIRDIRTAAFGLRYSPEGGRLDTGWL